MSPIVVMDTAEYSGARAPQGLKYRRPLDSRNFWTGKFRTAGQVRAFMCGDCGRIALYGGAPDA